MTDRIPQAAANRALAALERYPRHAERVCVDWRNPELYQAAALALDEVRDACRGVDELSSAWVGLLIAHAEFVHVLWQSARADSPVAGADRQRLLAQAVSASTSLRERCMALLYRP